MIYLALVDELIAKDMSERKANILAHMFIEYQLGHVKQIEALDQMDNKTTLEEAENILKQLEFFHANKK